MNNDTGTYKWFVLFLLTVVYAFNFMDRQVLIILQEDIKKDLLLSDTQLGLLTGLAFAILYTTLGIPIAKFADKHNRKNILALSLSFWSLMTMLCGRAQNFFHLLLARMGVSAGEAGGVPPSHSIISDYFPANQRATALGIYSSGVFFGVIMGFGLGGWIAANYGWRLAFYALGLLGILLAIYLTFAIKEPIRGQQENEDTVTESPSFKIVFSSLLQQKSFRYTCFAIAASNFASSSLTFFPSYMMRALKVDLVTIGLVLGLTAGLGGVVGTLVGGRIADVKGSTNKKWYLYVPLASCILTLLTGCFVIFTNDAKFALATIFPNILASSLSIGPVFAVGQSLAKPHMRAMATAIMLLFSNGIGSSFGPLFTGLLSDYFEPTFGDFSLRYAIIAAHSTMFLAAFLFWQASKHYVADLEKV